MVLDYPMKTLMQASRAAPGEGTPGEGGVTAGEGGAAEARVSPGGSATAGQSSATAAGEEGQGRAGGLWCPSLGGWRRGQRGGGWSR